ncbi:hydrogenase subunit domain protein [Burkholderia pseudomallei A79D]|nr:hydrogenase subunit domain protein [Burkholderia pseudomallei A79D]KGX95786.1 hydrogenase subunit domain protein [Burkholderia pseudomallei A79C]
MRIDALRMSGQTRIASAAGQPRAVFASVDADAWTRAAETIRTAGGRLVTLWGGEPAAGRYEVCAAYELDDGLLWLRLPVEPAANVGREAGDTSNAGNAGDADGVRQRGEAGSYPDLSAIFASATRMQRALHDLVGLRARRARHAAVARPRRMAARLPPAAQARDGRRALRVRDGRLSVRAGRGRRRA